MQAFPTTHLMPPTFRLNGFQVKPHSFQTLLRGQVPLSSATCVWAQ